MHSSPRTPRRTRLLTAIGPSAIVAVLLLGCAGPDPGVCPAIGYMSTATITLENPQPDLALEVCDGEGCLLDLPAQPAEIRAKEPTRDPGLVHLTGTSLDGWQAGFVLGGEQAIGYRLTDDAGAVIGEGHMALDWRRVDGTEQCGGNRQAAVELPV